MNFIQERYYRRKIVPRSANQRNTTAIPQLKECKSVCFFYVYRQEEQALRDIESFKKFHKDIHVIMFVEGKPYLGPAFTKLNVSPFYEHYFNLFGRISADSRFNLLSQKYDLLINTSPSLTLPEAMVHHMVQADFKIGRDGAFESISDISFLMDGEKTMDEYLQTIARYLNSLNG